MTDSNSNRKSIPPTTDVGEMSINGAHSEGVDEEPGDGNLDDSDGEGDSNKEEDSSEDNEETQERAKRFEAANAKADKIA